MPSFNFEKKVKKDVFLQFFSDFSFIIYLKKLYAISNIDFLVSNNIRCTFLFTTFMSNYKYDIDYHIVNSIMNDLRTFEAEIADNLRAPSFNQKNVVLK